MAAAPGVDQALLSTKPDTIGALIHTRSKPRSLMLHLRSSRGGIALVAAAALLVLGAGAAGPARGGGAHAVEIADFAFAPATLTIAVGDTVTWTNADPVVHTATSTSGAFDSGDLATGESYTLTFTAPGTHDYLCTPHPTMTGRIVVQAAPATAAPSPGGGLPNVAVPAPGASAPVPAAIALALVLVLGLAVGIAASRRRQAGAR